MSKRNQIQEELIKNVQKGVYKFYLVGITGRTSFILENLNAVKFKITIAHQLKCSCQPKQLKHCQHTLYLLLEIFYIPHDHPLLRKHNYTDAQLRYIIANRRIHDNKISDFLKYVKYSGKKRSCSIIMEEDKQNEEEQYNCAICQMEIVKQDATTACYNVCRNIFHLDCFTQWVKYQLKKNGTATCPLCRDQKNPQIVIELRKKQYEHTQQINVKKIGIEYHYYCDGCELKELQSNQNVYKCIECEDITLCEQCFKLGKHIRHSFIMKQVTQKKWRECDDRKAKKKIDFEQGLVRMKLPTSKRFINFLACSLPSYFSKTNRWNILECKKLDIKIDKLQCIACHDPQKSFLRKMHCGHFIHHKCLRKRIQKGRLYCKIDGQKFLLGYESLKKHQQLNQKVYNTLTIQQYQSENQEQQQNHNKSMSQRKNDLLSLNNRSVNVHRSSEKKRKYYNE